MYVCALDPLELGLQTFVWILETQLGSSERAVYTRSSISFEIEIHCNPVWPPDPPTSALLVFGVQTCSIPLSI